MDTRRFSLTKTLLCITFLFPTLCFGSMVGPYSNMQYPGGMYAAQNIDILREDLKVRITEELTAIYEATYTISLSESMPWLPLLFETDYNEVSDFTIWLNDEIIIPLPLPPHLLEQKNQIWKDIPWKHEQFRYAEQELPQGIHTIRVRYEAKPTVSLYYRVKEYVFCYRLAPGYDWNSFEGLYLTIETAENVSPLNIHMYDKIIRITESYNYHFETRPVGSEIMITYTPPISWMAKAFDRFGPLGFFLTTSLLLFLVHLRYIYRYRLRNPYKIVSCIVVLGCLLIPFVIDTVTILSFDLIDWIIGEEASRNNGQNHVIYLIYIIQMPIYMGIMWIIDYIIRKDISNRLNIDKSKIIHHRIST